MPIDYAHNWILIVKNRQFAKVISAQIYGANSEKKNQSRISSCLVMNLCG